MISASISASVGGTFHTFTFRMYPPSFVQASHPIDTWSSTSDGTVPFVTIPAEV